ncbi:hypothetical protein PMZ80_004143 [Knufia obscura]|uniref:Uncharacterized protein n=1 Tax=Knufia obscura TaxID=1635080 RepID=A0ABR0RRC1_9EURO|nr:hypothetical protein PMZ80_004143 [Knufia obscura]
MQQFYDVIEKALDYQKQCRKWAEVPRSQLEGCDFVSLARKEDPIMPSMSTLLSIGKGWVDLARAIGVVTFFGEGFGEMLKPEAHTCTPLPCNRFYIAITTSDIQKIMTMNRCNPSSTPRLISQSPSIIWHSQVCSLAPCGCEMMGGTRHIHSVVQVMWLKDFAGLLPESSEKLDFQKHKHGAIIFGHNDTVRHHMADVGPPILGIAPDPTRELELFEDSGIESSLSEVIEGTSPISIAPSLHDSTIATSTTPESRGQSYGNSNINGGHAVYGNIIGNVFVSQYYATASNQTGISQDKPRSRSTRIRQSVRSQRHPEKWALRSNMLEQGLPVQELDRAEAARQKRQRERTRQQAAHSK